MVIWPILLAVVAAALTAGAEAMHQRRIRNAAPLVFGPRQKMSLLAASAPFVRVLSVTGLVWGFATLCLLPPQVFGESELPRERRQHLLIALDVSPSMRAVDAGQEHKLTRMQRAGEALESIFRRTGLAGVTISVVAFYTEAQPVVVQSTDIDVLRNIMRDLPLHYLFKPGQTDVHAGIDMATRIAKDWPQQSTTLMVITDGDSAPSQKLPIFPPSIRDVVMIGVGDPLQGTAVNGEMSRQNAESLRQYAMRTHGTYHNANAKNLPNEVLSNLAISSLRTRRSSFGTREWALICVIVSSAAWAVLPVLLQQFGTQWRPGVTLQTSTVQKSVARHTSSRRPMAGAGV